MADPTSRERHVLDAAQELFLRNGLRATSMEAIAAAAGMAKPTLYKLFSDKHAVFAAVARRSLAEMRAAIDAAALATAHPVDRVAGMLTAKHKYVFRLLETSPHADELYAAPKSTAADELAALEAWLIGEVAACLVEAGVVEAPRLARILNASAHGIAAHAAHAGEIGPAIRLVTERLCAVGPTPAR